MPALNNKQGRSASDTLTLLWAANESFAGAFLHALNIPFKGMYLTGFSLLILQMIALSARGKLKFAASGFRVSAIKAVINPFASINSHLAVILQSVLAGIFLYKQHLSLLRLLLLSISAMLLSAIQRLFLLWLFYGMLLYDAVNIFIQKTLSEFGLGTHVTTTDFSHLILLIYLTAHFAAGIAAGTLIYRFTGKDITKTKIYEIEERLSQFSLRKQTSAASRSKKIKQLGSLIILIFLAGISYTISSENFPMLLAQIIIRYALAVLVLMVIRAVYLGLIKKRLDDNTDSGHSVAEDVTSMKVYFAFSYHETKGKAVYKKPWIFLSTLFSIARISAASGDK